MVPRPWSPGTVEQFILGVPLQSCWYLGLFIKENSNLRILVTPSPYSSHYKYTRGRQIQRSVHMNII